MSPIVSIWNNEGGRTTYWQQRRALYQPARRRGAEELADALVNNEEEELDDLVPVDISMLRLQKLERERVCSKESGNNERHFVLVSVAWI